MSHVCESQRLLFRHQVAGDLDALWALYRDPEVTRYIPDAPTTRDEAREELEWHEHGHPRFPELGLWATVEKSSGRFIGRCGLLPWTVDGRDEIEVAYTLARDCWGRGLGTEAAAAVRDYAFRVLGVERLIALIVPGNHASSHVAMNIGMRLEQTVEGIAGDGIPTDIYAMQAVDCTDVSLGSGRTARHAPRRVLE